MYLSGFINLKKEQSLAGVNMDKLKNLPITSYYVCIDKKEKKIKKLKFFSQGKYTNWGELDSKIAIKYADQNDLLNEIEEIIKHKEGEILYFTHRFYEKDKKHFIYVRIRIKIIKIEDNLIHCIGVNEDISKEKENESIVEKIKTSPHIGFIIYQENILYADEFTKKLLKIEDETKYKITDFAKLDDNFKRRFKGEEHVFYQENLELINTENERIFINAYSDTIYYNKAYAGLALYWDNTLNYKKEIIANIINEIGNLRLELLKNDKLEKIEFLKGLRPIFKKYNYNINIQYKKYTIGNIEHFDENLNIYNNGKNLYFKINCGEILIVSEFNDEFQNDLTNIYSELQKVINFTLKTIDKHLLLKLLNIALQLSFQWVIIVNENGEMVYVNDTVLKLSGFSYEEIIGQNPRIFKSGIHGKEFYKELWYNLKNNKQFDTVIINKSKDGELFHLKTRFVPVFLDNEQYYVALGIDITKEKELKKALMYDELTGLLNKKGFLVKASKKLKNKEFALLNIDIQNFKSINHIEGIAAGDMVLKNFAKFLTTFFREEDLIARLGNDEFAVLLEYDENNLTKILKSLIIKITEVENLRINIGISIYPKDADNINELIEKSYIALSLAKEEFENSFEFYTEKLDGKLTHFHRSRNLILNALRNDEFEYFFQPYYDLDKKTIVGCESLIRIVKADKVYSPYYFIEYAEKSGMILEIEEKMFNKIKDYYEKIKLPMSVNISAISLKKRHHLEYFKKLSDIPLTIELTEREITKDFESAKEVFEFLKQHNNKIAVDDFGTGYSSLTYIKELDFDVLKVDMSFVKGMMKNQKDYALVKTIITLAKELGLYTVAEGVENIEEMKLLNLLGCNSIQGYLLSPPLRVDEFIEFVKNFEGIKEG